MTRLLECLKWAEYYLQDGLGSRRYAKEPLGDNSRMKIEKCRDLLDRIIKEDGCWMKKEKANG